MLSIEDLLEKGSMMVLSIIHSLLPSVGFHATDSHLDTLHENNTYKAITILGPGYNLYYSVWCNNEYELYDMDVRPKLLKFLQSRLSRDTQ